MGDLQRKYSEENGEVTFLAKLHEIQMDSLVELCNHINEKHNIPLKCIGHNVKVEELKSMKE